MTIKDIAKAAGVSQTTVSHILNHKDGNISEATRQRVQRIIAESGYVPYERIRAQIMSKSKTIGLMLPTLNSAFYVSFASAMQKAAQASGFSLVLALTSGSAEAECASLSTFLSNKVDGILLFSGSDSGLAMLERYWEKGIAAIAIDHVIKNARFPRIYWDSHHIASSCTQLMLEHGCQKIGLLLRSDCGELLQDTIIDGCASSLQNAGLQLEQRYILRRDAEFMNNFRSLIDGGVDALVCQDADMATTIYSAAAKDNLRIPEDLSVISMEDSEDAAQLFPPLTAASTNVQEMAGAAFASLLAQINNQQSPFSTINVQVEIQNRDSICRHRPATSKIIVAGYINLDVLLSTPHLPKDGETQVTTHLGSYPGGRGSNQAYGISFLGGNACLIGKLGADRNGRFIYDRMRRAGVNLDGVSFVEKYATGKAYISLYPQGKSSVVIDPGANTTLNPGDIMDNAALFRGARFCVMQTDVAPEVVQALHELCLKNSVKIIMRSAYTQIPRNLLKDIYVLSISRENAALLCQTADMEEQTAYLLGMGVENVIFTEGASGCCWASKDGRRDYPAHDYPCVDGTGTNDVFIGCLAALLAEEKPFDDAVRAANWAAAYSTTKLGIQNGVPARPLLDEVMSGRADVCFPKTQRDVEAEAGLAHNITD